MTPPNPAAQALEPCPFCGAQAWLDDERKTFMVYCTNAACECASTPPFDTELRAIAAWNRRTPPPAPSADWITVPREPTEAMRVAGSRPCFEAWMLATDSDGPVVDEAVVWSAMLAAAPPPPAPDEAVPATLAPPPDDALVEITAKAAWLALTRGDDEPEDWWTEDDWADYHSPERQWEQSPDTCTHIGADGFRHAARAALAALRKHVSAPDEAVVERVAQIIHDEIEGDDDSGGGAYLRAARAALAALPHPIAGEKGE